MPSASVGKRSVPDAWWRSAVVYQIYVRSFADSNGDVTAISKALSIISITFPGSGWMRSG